MWPLTEDTSGSGKGALVAKAECGTALKASGAIWEESAPSRSEEDVFSNVGECQHSSVAEGKHPAEYSPTDIHPAHTQCCPPPLNPASCCLFPSNVKRGVFMAGISSVLQATCWVQVVFYPQVFSVWFLCDQSLSFQGCSHMVRVRLQGISVCFQAV